MPLKRNILVGKSKLNLFYFILFIYLFLCNFSFAKNNTEGVFTDLKILDKISSKNTLIQLKNGELVKFKDLSIKSLKCKNSEFDDNPEITAYIQVKDLTDQDKDEVFVFNGWMFSSSPSITPFDHPVYDVWLVNCY
ncbi:conserved hypothetical protein [Candidatus Pelagibacter sp. HTCC7211]|uniref:DUF2155 domain-containing protein n=1 Tax=Pelagibacter sp. (strain HTCC7211) TaxID=439493 RepID=UPI000183A203|nr:DUF2155 domain-containing protein [Candidatus Pelagibacter sp. HTCC7211]EDZ60469.1 conserved hypothetical protein [Candidatus Pelagibacter sp. HTCC7211]MBD1151094.1 DUF2155 domain-containing protein [Pelagibacterales bacterium SAG-MED25]